VADSSAESATTAAKRDRGKWLKNTLIRVASAAVLVPLVLYLLFWAPPWGWVVFCYVGITILALEMVAMTLPGRRDLQAVGVLGTLAFLSVCLFAPRFEALLGAVMGIAGAGAAASLIRPEPIEGASQRTAWVIAGPIYLGGLLSAVALLHQRDHGGSWVVLSMMFAFFSDTFAYFAGSLFGRHKLYPKVSPKKTVEGAVGGLVGAVAGALLAHFWYLRALPLGEGIALAIVAGIFGQVGDLCISLVKRSTGVKDTGKIMPGHGGLLDRVDALAFTASLTWIYAELWFDR
jgi:phosphatidate cytidylyltransferase